MAFIIEQQGVAQAGVQAQTVAGHPDYLAPRQIAKPLHVQNLMGWGVMELYQRLAVGIGQGAQEFKR
ncbi:hypothetical protein GCM10011378_11450 [Hymenobacter glacieicola]|uniref:Uncharacterized protein n=1 Tax=Hymenobacter glacieicola TaxID=1562124 RepID=A0ABQ1WM71_9BACT|nr:hypothetical protein GCM10011378_11450 [Hymenobacter glacieicola]